MGWKKTLTENIADLLRFGGYLFLLLDGIVLSVFAFYYLAKLAWYAHLWLDKQVFSSPW